MLRSIAIYVRTHQRTRRRGEAVFRLVTRKPPQWFFAGALVAHSFGILVGVIGIKVAHL
ncbi:MAG: hypothetical protein GY724_05525 [Actinomycetia bacterium]|nr:hypothetical protein [Actinomycetes bacterium]MCP4222722.1 hypothetical protein [Actinomycetes bacterium]MCP5034340.1 hypothetical protein [Actinomycetes bacterium]